jgi:hypothetical protein
VPKLINGKSNECAFGLCTQCSIPKLCKCKCLHAKEIDLVASSVRAYNDFARSHNLKPGYINANKADFGVFYRAASRLKDVPNLKHVHLTLTSEGRKRELEYIARLKQAKAEPLTPQAMS